VHLKLGKQYLVPGPGPQHRIALVAAATPEARWTIHVYDPSGAQDEAWGPVGRGLGGVLLRASTGDFLIPCERTECAAPPPHAGITPAGMDNDRPPWWVKDPRFNDVDDSGLGWHLQAAWQIIAVVDCDHFDRYTKKKIRYGCTVVTE
jgi:hypothetical protein